MALRVCKGMPTMDDVDKDKLYVCPYNKYHTIRAKIYPDHVAKCRRQYAGEAFASCPFNARHEFPALEYDYHIATCPDKKIIEQELTTSTNKARAPNVQPVFHFPESKQISPTEDWESEADQASFSLFGDPHKDHFQRNAFDVVEDFQKKLEEKAVQHEQSRPVLTDMSGLSKAQKKNLKRAQKRRERYNGDDGGDDDDDDGDDGDDGKENNLIAQDEETYLQQIASEYSLPGKSYSIRKDAFVDWVSILNQYCQKNKINQPKYSEAANAHGGFGAAVVVTTERFFTDTYCRTKKDAKHSAARAALLGLKIAISTPDLCGALHKGGGNLQRARELDQQREYLEEKLRKTESPRSVPGYHPLTATAPTRSQVHQTSTSQVTKQMDGMNIQNEQDEWQVAGSRRRDPGRPSGGNSLRLAGVGRGRARR